VKIVTVPDIRHIPPGGLSDPEVADLTCASNDVDVLLDEVSLARNNLNMDFTFGSYTKEIQCADAAVSLEPGSFALQYVAGMTNDDHTIDRASWANHPKNLSAAVEHFRAAVVLAPNFYEARKGLAEALRESGAFGDAEAEYLKLAQSDNPPPIQQEAEESLTHLYDDANDRPKALLSARTAEHIHETLSSLFGKEQDYTFSMGRADLAAREEEAGEYRQAAEDYLAARTFSSKDDFKANLFDYDTGRARNLRESGDSSDSAALCGEWQSQLFGPLHKLHLSPWWQWGGGLDVEQARWEFSCKDFDKGVQELFQIANSRLDHPHVNKDYRDELTTFFLMAPYEALESAFLYRRQPELARQARALHWRIYKIDHGGSDSEPDQTDIDGIKQLTQKLMSQTVALHPHPPILH
jgi:tetratricopeptide (TPR) repeat protein